MKSITLKEILKMESRCYHGEICPNDDIVMAILQLPLDRRMVDGFSGGSVSNDELRPFGYEMRAFFEYENEKKYFKDNSNPTDWTRDFGYAFSSDEPINYQILGFYFNDELFMFIPQFENGFNSESGKSVPEIFVFDESVYYNFRNVICEIIEWWGNVTPDTISTKRPELTKTLEDIPTGDMHFRGGDPRDIVYNNVFWDEIIRIENIPNSDNYKLMAYDPYEIEDPNDNDDFNGFVLKDIFEKCIPQKVIKDYLPLDVLYSISMIYNKLYHIDISYGSEFHKRYYKHGMRLEGYTVKQYVWIGIPEDDDGSIAEEGYDDIYFYCVFKDDIPICLVQSGMDALTPWIINGDEFMSLWVQVMYNLKLYKMLPSKYSYNISNADNIIINLLTLDETYYGIKNNKFVMKPVPKK